jgi:hypothetical protein
MLRGAVSGFWGRRKDRVQKKRIRIRIRIRKPLPEVASHLRPSRKGRVILSGESTRWRMGWRRAEKVGWTATGKKHLSQ